MPLSSEEGVGGVCQHKVSVVGPRFAVLGKADRIRTACNNYRKCLAEAVLEERPSLTKALKVPFPTKPRAPTSIVRSVASHLLELMFSTSSW